MRSFSDGKGRVWNLELTFPLVKEVRLLYGVDLLETSPVTFNKLSDPATLVDVLYVLCRAQANVLGVPDTQFGEALVGDPIDPATEALVQAIIDFFPQARRETLRKLFAEMKEVTLLHRTELVRLIESGEMRRRLLPKHLSAGSQDSSESIPPPGASGNSS